MVLLQKAQLGSHRHSEHDSCESSVPLLGKAAGRPCLPSNASRGPVRSFVCSGGLCVSGVWWNLRRGGLFWARSDTGSAPSV